MSFPLVGNSKVRDAVCTAFSCGKIPHAIIIEGEEGIGKKTLAKYIASAAVCDGENIPCGECRNCHLSMIGNHPDISVIAALDGKKNIVVGQIRELISEVYIKPHQADRRVFIIEGSDTMNEQAQNALLKVLEEPPADIIYILTCELAARLLPTVISRCVLFSLSAPQSSEAEAYLIKNQKNATAQEIKEALLLSANNIGKAQQLLSGKKGKIKLSAQEFLSAALNGDDADMMKIAFKFEKDRVKSSKFIVELKNEISVEIRKNAKNTYKAQLLFKFYEVVSLYEKSLVTNVNLTLFFTTIICKAVEIFGV